MSLVTPVIALLALLAGSMSLVEGFRLGHGAGNLSSHLAWGIGTLILQAFGLAITIVHARATTRRIATLEAEIALQAPRKEIS